ncbi:hypothetical protein DY000_02059884 [Brassica cretica]|uniref:SPX domain-containing protein n=1 Tax=Brassica cretica TaxID=69181 RepID=A0ABQ7AVL1_BRACR|nr:hypothetical protein DY000_02059884 [Brassica cretica]
MLSFEPKDMPTSEEALADPYFKNLAKVERELSCQPVTKLEFEFERRRIRKEDSHRTLCILVEHFKKQFAYLEEHFKNGLVFCTLVTTMRRHNRVQWKSLMDSPSVASEIHSDCVAAARPGKVVESVLWYNNCGAATGVEALEQQQRNSDQCNRCFSFLPLASQPSANISFGCPGAVTECSLSFAKYFNSSVNRDGELLFR